MVTVRVLEEVEVTVVVRVELDADEVDDVDVPVADVVDVVEVPLPSAGSTVPAEVVGSASSSAAVVSGVSVDSADGVVLGSGSGSDDVDDCVEEAVPLDVDSEPCVVAEDPPPVVDAVVTCDDDELPDSVCVVLAVVSSAWAATADATAMQAYAPAPRKQAAAARRSHDGRPLNGSRPSAITVVPVTTRTL
ncbi:hypothetical protein [Blastococcus deserti]|uniref:Uncharacterized protein n=1 Tax=Blastococcus deserti TaxID=2259033 RepID=A0ABW4X8G8_9ACTN